MFSSQTLSFSLIYQYKGCMQHNWYKITFAFNAKLVRLGSLKWGLVFKCECQSKAEQVGKNKCSKLIQLKR